jgi:hypothetical protein
VNSEVADLERGEWADLTFLVSWVGGRSLLMCVCELEKKWQEYIYIYI